MLRNTLSPTRRRKKVKRKDQLHYWRSLHKWVVYLKIILREPGMLRSKHTVKFSKGTWHQIKIRKRKGPSRGIIPKCAPHVLARQKSRTDHMRRPWLKNDAPAEEPRTGRKYIQAQEFAQSYVLCSLWSQRYVDAHRFKESRRTRIRSRFRRVEAHDEQKRIKFRRDGHSEKVHNPFLWYWLPTEKCTPTRRQRCSFMIKYVRNRAATRRNACCPIARQALRRPRILSWVGQRSQATIDPCFKFIIRFSIRA